MQAVICKVYMSQWFEFVITLWAVPRKIDPYVYLPNSSLYTFPNIFAGIKPRFKRSLLQLLNFLMWTIKLLLHYAVIYLFARMFTTVFIAHPDTFWHVESSAMWCLLLTIIVLLASAPWLLGKWLWLCCVRVTLVSSKLILMNTNTFVEIHHHGKEL